MIYDPLLRAALRMLTPAGARARLSVLIFHRVLVESDPLRPGEPTVEEFGTLLDWVRSWFDVLPLEDAVTRLKAGTLPARAAAISFDDGYADNYRLALPELKRRNMNAAFFIATDYLDGGCMFNDIVIESVRQCRDGTLDLEDLGLGRHALATDADRRAAIASILPGLKYRDPSQRAELADRVAERARAGIPRDLMMNSGEVAALAQEGMAVGAHTASHPILARLDVATARADIVRGRERLESLTGRRVGLFAYPNGRTGDDYNAEVRDLVRDLGFDAAFTTMRGSADGRASEFELPRFTPWDRTRAKFAARMLMNTRHDAGQLMESAIPPATATEQHSPRETGEQT